MENTSSFRTSQAGLTSVHKAFHVMEYLAACAKPAALGEVAKVCGLSKPSTVRLLKVLQSLGYADRPRGSHNYCIGPKVADLASADPNANLKKQARPLLESIHNQINETVNLAILSGQRIIYVDFIETTRPLRMIVAPSDDTPWFRTALGRAIAAHLPGDERKRLLQATDFTENSARGCKCSARNMTAKLEIFRKQGCAEEIEEAVEGAACLAVSLAPLGYPLAAISVAVPTQRLAASRKRQILNSLINETKYHQPQS